MNHVEIIEPIDDLNQVVYDFWLYGIDLYLNSMKVQNRESKRHKFKTDFSLSYSRILNRDFGIKEEPEIDIAVQAYAIEAARKNITFKIWSRK